MKIHFEFELTEDDYKELVDNFETIEFIEIPWNENKEVSYEEVIIDTKDLLIEEFDDWIKQWLNSWYKLELKWCKYMITY